MIEEDFRKLDGLFKWRQDKPADKLIYKKDSDELIRIKYKSKRDWMRDFYNAFLKYGQSIYENCNVWSNTDEYLAVFIFTIVTTDDYMDKDKISLDFKNDAYVYSDEFDEIVIMTSNIQEFCEKLNKLHPGFEWPELEEK